MLKTEHYLAEGSILKNLLTFSFPLIISNLLQAAFNVTDMVIVSFYKGPAGLSAIGIGGLITYLIINGAAGLSGGLTLLIGKLYGAKKEEEIKKTIGSSAILFFILSIMISMAVIFAGGVWLRALATPVEAMTEARRYVTLSMTGLLFVFAYNGVAAVSKGLGDGKLPLLIIFTAAVLNAGLDFLLIAGCNLGAGFTAISNITAEAVAAAMGIIILIKKQPLFRLKKADFVPDRVLLKELTKLGAPLAILNVSATLSFMLLTYIVNRIGAEGAVYASGAHAIATKYNGIALLPARAVSLAIGAMVAQNLGANKPKRNKKTLFVGLAISLGIGIVISLFSFLFPEAVFHLFGAGGDTADFGKDYMRFMSFDYMIVPFAVSAYGLADGFGKTYATMTINIISSIAIRAPFAYAFGIVLGLGMKGIGLSIITASVSSVILSWLFLLFMKEKPLRIKGS
ncbi:MAG: MATE family efflux transporter [Clostridia bacterium]|nr:MATE family efflux transporter [Clostridia bacterium]